MFANPDGESGAGPPGVRSMGDDPPDSFSEACGLAGPLKVRLEGPGRPGASTLEFRRPFLVVGRDERADLPIDSPEVSRRHAYFQVVARRVFCVDLISRTGVRWDDGVRSVGWVDRGRGVEVGPARIRFEGDEAGSLGGGNLPVSRSFEWPSLPDARLEFLGAESGREPWQVSRVLVLMGRSPTCRVRLDGAEVAAIHASLVRTPSGVWVVDLLGRGGVLVGGSPARSARLEDGDEIGLGGHRIRVRIGQAARPSGRSELATRSSGRGGRPARAGPGLPAGPGPEVGGGGRGLEDLKGSLDPVTERLFDQFERMHQQTTEQFRQAILMMFRMHQDQMGLIREELSRLDQLEEEQRSLQAAMARGNHPRPPRTALRLVSGEPASSPLPQEVPGPARARPEADRVPGRRPVEAPAPEAGSPRGLAQPHASGQPGKDPLLTSEPDPHDQLSRRLAEIQDERQGLWKRLLGSLTGGESGRILP
jgi:pSer/pThr/pTyr-binding forkhead associated (FHA) protein